MKLTKFDYYMMSPFWENQFNHLTSIAYLFYLAICTESYGLCLFWLAKKKNNVNRRFWGPTNNHSCHHHPITNEINSFSLLCYVFFLGNWFNQIASYMYLTRELAQNDTDCLYSQPKFSTAKSRTRSHKTDFKCQNRENHTSL